MRPPVIVTLCLSMAGMIVFNSPGMADDAKTVLALVNGTAITTDEIGELNGVDATGDFAALAVDKKAQLTVALINRQLVFEQAKKEGFDRSEPVVNAVKGMTETYIVKQYLVKVAAGTDLSEQALRAYYEDNFLHQPEQYEVAHILLASEDEANSVLAALGKGARFSDLAKANSKDKVSAAKGGDLGWLSSADLLPAFYQTVSGLAAGEISSRPTQTQFGWHIIQLNDKRNPTAKPLEQVKQLIQQALIEKHIAAYLENLRDNATIEVR